jgi:hypothetical protein
MQNHVAWTKAIGAVVAIVVSPAVLIFAVPFAVGITRDMLSATGLLPALITVACAIGFGASLSTRLHSR